jgi:hypothetical protein
VFNSNLNADVQGFEGISVLLNPDKYSTSLPAKLAFCETEIGAGTLCSRFASQPNWRVESSTFSSRFTTRILQGKGAAACCGELPDPSEIEKILVSSYL